MSGALNHSPADVVRHLLIDLGHGTEPVASGASPIFCDMEPDDPDNLLTVFNTTGVIQGRTHYDGETQEHYGVQVRGRNASVVDGYIKLQQILVAFDQDVIRTTVNIGSDTYTVQAVTRTSAVINITPELGATRRWIHVGNAVVSLRMEPGTGTGS